ncbi:GntR family transcriptional regulator [Streptomyces sp. NPDC001212]
MLGEYRIEGRRAAEIAASIERAVGSGDLEPGQPLPPMRELAAELGVNPNTVAAAYRTLRAPRCRPRWTRPRAAAGPWSSRRVPTGRPSPWTPPART